MPATWEHDGTMSTEREVTGFISALVWAAKPETVVETGTFAGNTTAMISESLVRNEYGHLYTVESNKELYDAYPELPRTTFINENSLVYATDMAPLNIDMAFVDCGEPEHRVQVARTLKYKIRGGGFLLVHDYLFYQQEEFLLRLTEELGTPSFTLRTLHGLAGWQC